MSDKFNNLDDFKYQYSGQRDPANNKWYGLEFKYLEDYYRFDYINQTINLSCLIIVKNSQYPDIKSYKLLSSFSKIDDALDYCVNGKKLKDILLSKEIELLGQD